MNTVDVLRNSVEGKKERTRRELELALKDLASKVQTAQKGLANGEELDVNMIMNASGITRMIAVHNFLRDIDPYMADLDSPPTIQSEEPPTEPKPTKKKR